MTTYALIPFERSISMHALIIEDHPMIAALIECVLMDCGFDTFDIAASCKEAILAAAQRCPDLITADVTLESGNGIEAIRIICPGQSTPLIFITGLAAAEVRAKVTNYPVIHKPFSEQTLTYAVAASLNERVGRAALS